MNIINNIFSGLSMAFAAIVISLYYNDNEETFTKANELIFHHIFNPKKRNKL